MSTGKVKKSGWKALFGVPVRRRSQMFSEKRSKPESLDHRLRELALGEMALPTEIVYDILGHCRDDADTLRSCSLVSFAFAQLSQELLFRSVVLEDKPWYVDGKGPSRRFQDLLMRSPHLAKHVRCLSIHTDAATEDRPRWILSDSLLLDIVKQTRRLEGFSFVIRASGTSFINWLALPLPVREAIVVVLSMPTLASLSIDGLYQIPTPLFNLCFALEELSLSNFCLSSGKSEDYAEPALPATPRRPGGHRIRIKRLAIHHCQHHHKRLIQWFAESNCPFTLRLKSFDYSSDAQSGESTFAAIALKCAPALGHLAYTAPSYALTMYPIRRMQQVRMPRYPPISFSNFSALIQISFTFTLTRTNRDAPVTEPATGYTSGLPYFITLLQTFPTHNRLAQVELTIKAEKVNEEVVSLVDWEDFMTVLRSGLFSYFETLRINCRGDRHLSRGRMVKVLRTNAALLEHIWDGKVELC